MFRRIILLILLMVLALAALVALPFVLSSYYIDQRGIPIPGKVFSKREHVIMRQTRPRVQSELIIEYNKPNGSGAGFVKVIQSPEYDALTVGSAVKLLYLRAQDVPAVPFAAALRKMQLLPTVHMAGQGMFSGIDTPHELTNNALPIAVLCAAALLLVWRIIRLPGFIWIAFCCFVVLGVISVFSEFPRPTPAPSVDIRDGIATVKSLDRISTFFNGQRSRGMDAVLPIDVVGLEFTPQGRTDPVVTVDLIDAGSNAGLQEKALVPVSYELAEPRVAHIRNASRNFVARNLTGFVTQSIYVLAACAGLLLIAHLLGRGYKRLISNSSSRTN